MSKLDVSVYSNNFLQLLLKIFKIVLIVSAVFSVVMGIIGVISYKQTGVYPVGLENIPKLLGGSKNMDYGATTDNSLTFMTSGSIFAVVMILWAINFVISSIVNFADKFLKELFSCICGVLSMIPMFLMGIGVIGNKYEGIVYISFLALFIASLLLIKGTIGGKMVLYATIAFFVHLFGIPFILWLVSIGLRKIISAIITFLVIAVVLSAVLHSSGESSSSGCASSSGSSRSSDKKRAKLQSELNSLNKKIADKKHGLKMHDEGSTDYMFVDEKVARSEIRNAEKRKSYLEEQLNR